jgi:wobble nucleotide-excising tRNase
MRRNAQPLLLYFLDNLNNKFGGAMFEKIDIKKFGSFNDFTWDASLTNLKKINLFYGRNYSGKTTLSRIFRSLEEEALHKNFTDAQFSLSYKSNSKITEQNLTTNPVNDRVFVYNSDFVKANLSGFHDENGNIMPFSVAGQVNQEIIKKIERYEGKKDGESVIQIGLIERISSILKTRTEHFEAEDRLLISKKTGLESVLTIEAASIKKNADFLPQAEVGGYNRNILTNEINVLKNTLTTRLPDKDIEKYKNTIRETAQTNDVGKKQEVKPKFEARFNNAKELLAKTITISQPIDVLLHNHSLEAWVDTGIALHRDKHETCAFCDSTLSPEDWQARWAKLDAHFSQESKKLTDEINAEIQQCNTAKQGITDYLIFDKR